MKVELRFPGSREEIRSLRRPARGYNLRVLESDDVTTILAAFEDGLITHGEKIMGLVEAASSVAVTDLVDLLAPQDLEELIREARRAPWSEESWGKWFSVRPVCAGPEFDSRAYNQARDANYRLGIEALRRSLEIHAP